MRTFLGTFVKTFSRTFLETFSRTFLETFVKTFSRTFRKTFVKTLANVPKNATKSVNRCGRRDYVRLNFGAFGVPYPPECESFVIDAGGTEGTGN